MSYLLTGEKTLRTKFRLLEKEDFDTWLPIFEQKDTGRFLGMDAALSVNEKCEKWFEKAFWRYENGTSGMNVMVHQQSQKFIGQVGLLIQTVNGLKRLEVGYSILPKYWNMGYAKEAAIFLRDIAFTRDYDKGYGHSLISVIHKENLGSIQVALHNGMSLESTYQDDSNQETFLVYSISRKEWECIKDK